MVVPPEKSGKLDNSCYTQSALLCTRVASESNASAAFDWIESPRSPLGITSSHAKTKSMFSRPLVYLDRPTQNKVNRGV
jgi:hypothetical protein